MLLITSLIDWHQSLPGTEHKQPKSTTHVHLCHICGPPKLFCLTSLRRHLARIHSQNYKCSREECGRFFKEKSQLDAHEETHRMRECHLCGRKFQRKQNADIHLMGVHHLKTEDLEKLGRWNPRGDDPTKCPESPLGLPEFQGATCCLCCHR